MSGTTKGKETSTKEEILYSSVGFTCTNLMRDEIDAYAADTDRSRSAVIRLAVRYLLNQPRIPLNEIE